MRNCLTLLVFLLLLSVASPVRAVVGTYVNETFDGYANGNSILANDPANWSLTGDSIPPGSTVGATISTSTSVSPDKSLKMTISSGEVLLRPRWNRDLTDAPISIASPVTSATVSFDFHYNYDVALSPSDVSNPKSYPQDTWIYVRNHINQLVGMLRLNGGVYDWKFGVNYQNGASARGVRESNWYNVDITYDFAAQTASYFLDNIFQYSESVAGLLDPTAGLSLIQFENGINGPSGVENNTSFLDNLVYTADIIPEPAALSLFGLGGLRFRRARRG